eukprot:4506491-Pleurochrysis_carterae.AAC.5
MVSTAKDARSHFVHKRKSCDGEVQREAYLTKHAITCHLKHVHGISDQRRKPSKAHRSGAERDAKFLRAGARLSAEVSLEVLTAEDELLRDAAKKGRRRVGGR